MKKLLVFLLAFSMLFGLAACGGIVNPDGSSNSATGAKKIETVCDVTKYANISSAELISLLGEPDDIVETTPATGFVEIPCTYYDYYNAHELGEVSFILINDIVAKFTAYNDFPYYKNDDLLESLNVDKSDKCATSNTGAAIRYRCVTDEIDDIWVSNIDGDTYGFLAVTYDMMYFEEWYLTMDISEQSDYQYWTQEYVKNILKSPKSADFPNINSWAIVKNNFYVAAQSYVDAVNSFGVEIRSDFTFIYPVGSNIAIYAVFDGDVILDNGYVPTADLVKQLVSEIAAGKEAQPTVEQVETHEPQPESPAADTTPQTPSESTYDQTSTIVEDTKQESAAPVGNPTFTGSTCLTIDTSTGMPASNVTNFNGTDSVMIAGKLTGVSGENHLLIRWVFPDGYVEETMLYYIANNQTINTAFSAEYIGSGSGSVSVIMQSTGQTLATYYYTVTGAPTYINDTENVDSSYDDPYGEMDEVNKGLAEQEFLAGLPSLDGLEWESDYENDSDLDGIVSGGNELPPPQVFTWISDDDLGQYGLSAAWMGETISIWEKFGSATYTITGSPKSQFESGVEYVGNCNGYSIRFRYNGGIEFYFSDLVNAGIIK